MNAVEKLKKKHLADKAKENKAKALLEAKQAKELQAQFKREMTEHCPKEILRVLGKLSHFRRKAYTDNKSAVGYALLPGHAPIQVVCRWDLKQPSCRLGVWTILSLEDRQHSDKARFLTYWDDDSRSPSQYVEALRQGEYVPDKLAEILVIAEQMFAASRALIVKYGIPSPLQPGNDRVYVQGLGWRPSGAQPNWDPMSLDLCRQLWPEEIDMRDYEVNLTVKVHAATAAEALTRAVTSVQRLPVTNSELKTHG